MAGWTALHAHLHQTLRSRGSGSAPGLLPPDAAVLIALSGGQDSQCLLQLLVDLRAKWGWQLHGVHCHHRWRPDGDANAEFVVQWAARQGVPCQVQLADSPPPSEAAARLWRYHVFATVARAQGCTHVVTGHTASDRAETLLYNLIRGSGTDGLQALTWQRPLHDTAPDILLVRPLLNIARAQTAEFCQTFDLPVWLDTTNEDRTYARNRLRLDVLPPLRSQFNPQVDTTLAQTAEILTAEVAFLEAEATALAQRCVVAGRIQRRSLGQAPLALQRRVIRQVLRQQLAFSPQFDHVEKVVALLAAPHRSQSDPFPGGAIAIVNHDWVELRPSP
ncbi:MAG TPA: tRNA lysidine(34) synthetase TilS [Candidatus Obscuribacterales bacterium]